MRKLAPELKFYNMLFPPEKDKYKHILGIDAIVAKFVLSMLSVCSVPTDYNMLLPRLKDQYAS